FAYQHREGLLLRKSIRAAGDQSWLAQIRGEALKIALERPVAWEFRLFAHALADALKRHHQLRRRYEAGIPISIGEDVTSPSTWLAHRFADALRMIACLNTLLNVTTQEAFGPQGVSGDAEKLVFVAE